jgi:beta-fructofuranosidase
MKPTIVAFLLLFAGSLSGQADKPPYVSAVPKFTFSNTLPQQQEELKNNPLLARFAASRKKQSSDRYRPLFHFVSPESTLNDPNGLSFWQGNWHMFYQAYPPEDRRQHWGHAISRDLIHWQDLPYAIYPSPERAVFSGSALVEDNRVIAMYHGTEVGNMVAVSSDPLLLNWDKVTGTAVVPIRSKTGFPLPYSVFDPSIWKSNGVYYSLSAGRVPNGPGGKPVPVGSLFRSKDLANWEYVHEFVENDRFTVVGDDYACPYFWPLGDRYIMPFYSHMRGGQYLLGDYDTARNKFVVTQGGKFNFGPSNPSGVHAPSATPDGKGGVIVIFNMNAGKPTGEWDMIMSLPRRLSLIGKDEVGQEPAGNIESLRYNRREVKPMTLTANKEIVLQNIRGNSMEVNLEIDPKDVPMLELNVLRSPKKEEYTRIVFMGARGMGPGRNYRFGEVPVLQSERPAAGTTPRPQFTPPPRESLITIESSMSSLHPDVRPRGPETAPFYLSPGENLKLRIFVDRSVVEVFVNGKQCVAARVYPSREDATGVSIRSQGKDSELKSLEAWQMKSIYE